MLGRYFTTFGVEDESRLIDQNSNNKVPRCFKILTLPLVVSVVSVNMSFMYYVFGPNWKKFLFSVYLYLSA